MKNKLKWRLGKLPSPDEVIMLVKDKLITNEEAREILFNEETEEDRDKESLQAEIKFLRDLTNRLADSKSSIVEQIRYIEKPYQQWGWYPSYGSWCATVPLSNGTITGTATVGGSNTLTLSGASSLAYVGSSDADIAWSDDTKSFTDIKTF